MLADVLRRQVEITWNSLFPPKCSKLWVNVSCSRLPLGKTKPTRRKRHERLFWYLTQREKNNFIFVFNSADVALISFCSQATYREAMRAEGLRNCSNLSSTATLKKKKVLSSPSLICLLFPKVSRPTSWSSWNQKFFFLRNSVFVSFSLRFRLMNCLDSVWRSVCPWTTKDAVGSPLCAAQRVITQVLHSRRQRDTKIII